MYLDPGFGSMVIQMVIASFAVAGTMFGIFRHKVKEFFNRKRDKVEESTVGESKVEEQVNDK